MHPEEYVPSFFHISFHLKVIRDLEGFWAYNRQLVSLWENLSKDSDLKYRFLDTLFSAAELGRTFIRKLLHFVFSLCKRK